MKSSNIGGQAVLEGIMMKHKDEYAVAVRRADGSIVTEKKTFESLVKNQPVLTRIPFVRGIFQFLDSMILGMRTLTFSAEIYGEEEEKSKNPKEKRKESILMGLTVAASLCIAIGIFMVLPYLLTMALKQFVPSYTLRTLIEGIFRIGIFFLYLLLISRMQDIRRTFMYHGAEHKCINCIEHGLPLTVENVKKSSRQHKRCGTSFLVFVFLISVVLLLMIRVEDPIFRVLLRVLLIPVIAGISYEILKLAGSSDSRIIRILSAPGLQFQKLTTKEPDEGMIEVAICAVEAVFDWRAYEAEQFHTSKSI